VRAAAKSARYHRARKKADARTVRDYGVPVKTLYTERKFFSLHNRIFIKDEDDALVYKAHSRILSLHDRTWVETASGAPVAKLWRKLLSLHERHYVEMADGRSFQLSNELFHLIKDVTNIEELGWVIEGNLLELNFTIRNRNGRMIAAVGQKFLSVHDRFSIDIYAPEEEPAVVAAVIALQHILQDRQASRAAAASASAGAVSSASSSN
jgi:uncharacterized protein YxjI